MQNNDPANDTILNRPAMLPLPLILRPPALVLVAGGLYAILVLPLAISLLGEKGVPVALYSGLLATLIGWMVVPAARNFTNNERQLIRFIIAVLSSIASVTTVWVYEGDGSQASETVRAIGRVSIMLASVAISGFAVGMVRQPAVRPRLAWDAAARDATARVTVGVNSGLLILVGQGARPAPSHWFVLLLLVVGLGLAWLLGLIGWAAGCEIRRFLQSVPWIFHSLKRLGPPLGLFMTGYVLLAFLFGTLHAAIWKLDQHAYSMSTSPSGLRDFLYFSVVTLATVGYGDIAPVSGPARLCATAEIVVGQLWVLLVLAIVLTRLSTPGPEQATTAKD